MSSRRRLVGAVVLAAVACLGCDAVGVASSQASETRTAERITLRAQKPDGVPVHDSPGAGALRARLPDGSRVEVLEKSANGRWLRVRDAKGTSGWITRRYVAPGGGRARTPSANASGLDVTPAPPSVPRADVTTLDARSAWASRQGCEALLAKHRSLRPLETARLGAWNLRWFPDGVPGRRAAEQGTDVDWVACALAYLDVDVVALSEIKAHPSARAKLDRVRRRLDGLTGGEWRVELDGCRPDPAQHVALLWNARRVRAADFEVYAVLNPRGSACADQLRPGLGGYFRFPGGLDLSVVAVHLKSGTDARALELRARSFARVADVHAASRARHDDDDLVVLGDFNTMGCARCAPSQDPGAELAALDGLLAAAPRPLARVPLEPACSHYFQGQASLLDLVVAPASMRELGSRVRARAAGVCAELACGPAVEPLPAQRHLSDHCPIVIDLVDRDLDSPSP